MEFNVMNILLYCGIILLATKLLGMFTRKLGLPQVVGMIIAGLLIGPALLGGGMIPTYIVFTQILHLDNSLLVLIVPGCISVYNMIVMRTNFAAIPASLEESVKVDGGNDIHVLWNIVLPLSKAILAVMVLFYGVAYWNAWFNAMLYINDTKKVPLQLALRAILLQDKTDADAGAVDNIGLAENIKYATILVATIPILIVYPFVQKYFVKGIMIGAVKG